jgi:hypothetical protein
MYKYTHITLLYNKEICCKEIVLNKENKFVYMYIPQPFNENHKSITFVTSNLSCLYWFVYNKDTISCKQRQLICDFC